MGGVGGEVNFEEFEFSFIEVVGVAAGDTAVEEGAAGEKIGSERQTTADELALKDEFTFQAYHSLGSSIEGR